MFLRDGRGDYCLTTVDFQNARRGAASVHDGPAHCSSGQLTPQHYDDFAGQLKERGFGTASRTGQDCALTNSRLSCSMRLRWIFVQGIEDGFREHAMLVSTAIPMPELTETTMRTPGAVLMALPLG
jgi:hypothetical protein